MASNPHLMGYPLPDLLEVTRLSPPTKPLLVDAVALDKLQRDLLQCRPWPAVLDRRLDDDDVY